MTELLTSQLGTVSHMPPELFQLQDKRLSKKADVYAIGMLIFEAATPCRLGTFWGVSYS